MNNCKEVNMRCDCHAEMASFCRHDWQNGEVDYELAIEDAYCGGDYIGIKGRFKRAWRAFWAKPICYAEVYCEDGKRMKKFLEDCLGLMGVKEKSNGHWYLDSEGDIHCDQCDWSFSMSPCCTIDDFGMLYCPHCGAEMSYEMISNE